MLHVLQRTVEVFDGRAIMAAAEPAIGQIESELRDFRLLLHCLDGVHQVVNIDAIGDFADYGFHS